MLHQQMTRMMWICCHLPAQKRYFVFKVSPFDTYLSVRYRTFLITCPHSLHPELRNFVMSWHDISARTQNRSKMSYSGGMTGRRRIPIYLTWPLIISQFQVSPVFICNVLLLTIFLCQLPPPMSSVFSARVGLFCHTFGTAYQHSQHVLFYVSVIGVYWDILKIRTSLLLQFYQKL